MRNRLAPSFDYAGVDAASAAVARNAATMIRSRFRDGVQVFVEIGETLIAVKAAIGHGNFLPWLHAEFNWTERNAQNYMITAERFGTKCETISYLPPTVIYKLAAAPDTVRDPIVKRLEAGDKVPVDEIRDSIAQEAKRAREDRRHARLKSSGNKKALAREERFQKQQAKAEAERQQRDRQREAALQQLAQILRSKLSDDEIVRVADLLDELPGWGVASFLRGAA